MESASSSGRSFKTLFPDDYLRILAGIEYGVPVDYVGDRTFGRFGPNLPINDEDIPKVDAVIQEDVAAGKKAGPFALPPFDPMCISPIGCVPKKNSTKVRVIHHLSFPHGGDSVNASILEEPLKLPNFGHAARAVRRLGRGALLIKIDVSAAYKQVPVRREDWPLLGFLWEGKYYYERVLPFGLRSSCRLWDLYAAALHFFLYHQTDVRCPREVIHYVDDFLFVIAPGRMEEALRMLDRARAICAELGLPLADVKTEGPCTRLTFLGIELDSAELVARLPAQRLQELKLLVMDWGSRPHASIRDLQSLAGLLNFACYVVRPGRFYVRRIFNAIARLQHAGVHPNAEREVDGAVRADIAWWSEFLSAWNGHSIIYDREWLESDRIELFTDACERGYGGHYGKLWFAGRWSPAIWGEAVHGLKTRSMPFLELYALVAAALLWGHKWVGKKITFRCDCKPVVDAIKDRASRSRGMMHLLRILCHTACMHGFDFRAEWIEGAHNIAADALSRHGFCQEFRDVCPSATPQDESACPSIPLPLPLASPCPPPTRLEDRPSSKSQRS